MADDALPLGFEDLAPFQAYWGVGTIQERRDRREAASMAEITAFYEVMLARAPDAMKHLEAFPIDALPPAETRLYELVLMLAHVSMATELHGSPRAPNTPYPHGVRLVQAPALFG
ncbi:hypothetical protein [Sphingomonas sp. ID0503]|uniref:hypothetical protein n=1 Tax=Sphingomonas sp. ID0503 TaxID=3399691 RepID=UPI003AFA3F3A